MNGSKDVDKYLADAPKVANAKLRQIRAAIREAAPDAEESISYGMPHYSFRGESGFQSRLCYFGLMKDKKRIAFYTRPGFLEDYQHEVAPYLTTKSALQFPLEKPIPVQLIRKLVKNARRRHASTQS